MAETWDDAEIDTFIGELLETSGNDFNLVMKEIDKLKTDMATKDESEVEEEEDDPFDPEELKRIQEEAKLEAAQRLDHFSILNLPFWPWNLTFLNCFFFI